MSLRMSPPALSVRKLPYMYVQVRKALPSAPKTSKKKLRMKICVDTRPSGAYVDDAPIGAHKKGVLPMTHIFTFPHDGAECDFDALPEPSKAGIISRGLRAIFSNEVASQLTSHIKGVIAGEDGKASEVSTEAVKAYHEANGEALSPKVREFSDGKKQAILEGKLGMRAAGSGSSVDPLMKEMLALAKAEIRSIFTKKGWTFPTKDGTSTVTIGGNAVTLDASGWVSRWMNESNDRMVGGKGELNRGRLEKLAQRNLREKAALAKRVEDAAEGEAEGL